MIKRILLTLALFIAFIIVAVIYQVIVSPDNFKNQDSDFQGPPSGEIFNMQGPSGPPPSE